MSSAILSAGAQKALLSIRPLLIDVEASVDFVKIGFVRDAGLTIAVQNNLKAAGAVKKQASKHPGEIYGYSEMYALQVPNGRRNTIRILYPNDHFMPVMVKIEHPDRAVMAHMRDAIFKGVPYKVSSVEYSADMLCADPQALLNFVRNNSNLKWARSTLTLGHPTSHYLNNPRKSSSKGSRVYIKSINGREVVRFEMIVKRPVLKQNNINNINQLLLFHPLTFFRHVVFKPLHFNQFFSMLKDKPFF